MEDITFAPATAADLPAVRALLERCELPTADLDAADGDAFLVCRVDGRLAGAIGLETFGALALLRSLAVAPEFRGRRLAHDLWARLRAVASGRGVRRLYLLTTTAEGLFSRWGFDRVVRESVPDAIRATAEFAALCPSTAAIMVLDLTAA